MELENGEREKLDLNAKEREELKDQFIS